MGSSRITVGDDEDVEVLEDVAFTRKAKKPRTAYSKSPQNIDAEVRESEVGDKKVESRSSEGLDCDHSAHMKKFFERKLLISVTSVQDLELNKTSVDTALRNVENIIKDWDRLQERVTWLQRALHESKKEMRLLTKENDKLKADLLTAKCDVA
ncbi:hypothetical protein Fot_19763 [Forsythia ovata]|uniref:Uncharacterized protein n=1 Tax=Forsythia ovata TaxID=205694 RepID=A0ABD1VMB2_9LAMI